MLKRHSHMTYIHVYTITHTLSLTDTHTHSPTHQLTHPHTHTYSLTHTHTHTHSPTHTHILTHPHTHPQSLAWYRKCRETKRNMGLFTANQNLKADSGSTRQNPAATRRGYEWCVSVCVYVCVSMRVCWYPQGMRMVCVSECEFML
jgi:hypothetical protein